MNTKREKTSTIKLGDKVIRSDYYWVGTNQKGKGVMEPCKGVVLKIKKGGNVMTIKTVNGYTRKVNTKDFSVVKLRLKFISNTKRYIKKKWQNIKESIYSLMKEFQPRVEQK